MIQDANDRHARLAGRMAEQGHRAALREVLKVVGLEAVRFRRIGAAAAAAASQAWSVWSPDGRGHALRCHAVSRKFPQVAFELDVLRYLADRGWSVPIPSGPPVESGGRVFSLAAGSPAGHSNRRLRAIKPGARSWRDCTPHYGPSPAASGSGRAGSPIRNLERTLVSRAWREGLRLVEAADAELAAAIQAAAERTIEQLPPHALAGLPTFLLHGDFADWNVLGGRGIPSAVIDFDLCHVGVRPWEFAIARVHRAPRLVDGYRAEADALGISLTPEEARWLPAVNRAFRIHMLGSALGDRVAGTPDLTFIRRQLQHHERGLGAA
jgi:Ser/Thr protein kinase RdoA (MazF antagonist)